MIRRVLSRFRVVAPPGWWVVVWLASFAAFEGPVLYFERQVGGPLNLPIRPGRISVDRRRRPARLPSRESVSSVFPAGLFAMAQIDAMDGTQAIAGWTAGTGPGGHAGTRRIDAIQHDSDRHPLDRTDQCFPVQPFDLTGRDVLVDRGSGLRLLRGLVPGVRPPALGESLVIDLAVLTTIYLFVHEGLWRSLASFPWSTEGHSSDPNHLVTRQEKEFGPSCGWPHDRFHRDVMMAKGIRASDARLDQHADRLVVLCPGTWVSRSDAVPGGLHACPPRTCSSAESTISEDTRLRSVSEGESPPSAGSSRVTIKLRSSSGSPSWPFPSVIALHAFLGMDPRQAAPVLVGGARR